MCLSVVKEEKREVTYRLGSLEAGARTLCFGCMIFMKNYLL